MPTSRFRAFSLAATCFWLLVIGGTISTHAQTRSYVAHPTGTITVLDTETNAIVDTITVCTDFTCSPLIPVATPDGARLYVTNVSHDTVSVINTLTNSVVDTITVGQSPWGIAITPDGKRAYVANGGSNTISAIDTGTNTVIATITDTGGPFGVAIMPDGTRAYVSNADGTVSVVDISTNTIITSIPITDFPRPGFGFPARDLVAIVITPDGTRAYVVSHSTSKIYVISTMFNTMIDTIPASQGPASGGPLSLAMSPDGTRVYTAFPCCETIVVDTFSNTISQIIPSGGAPPFVGVTPDGTKLYKNAVMAVTIFDTSTFSIITNIQFDLPMGGVAFATLPEVPHSKDDCKDSGFQHFSVLAFRNQGQCIKYVNEHAK
jgi:YVTN family beta-propeller protein